MRTNADDQARVRDPANELLLAHPPSVLHSAHSGSPLRASALGSISVRSGAAPSKCPELRVAGAESSRRWRRRLRSAYEVIMGECRAQDEAPTA